MGFQVNKKIENAKQPLINNKKKNLFYDARPFRKRLILASLCSFMPVFTVVIFGATDIFINNREEFPFDLGDYIVPLLLIAFASFVVLTGFMLLFRGKAFDVVFAVVLWGGVMGYIQGNFLNFGITNLSGDGTGGKPDLVFSIIDTVIWLVVLAAFITFALVFRERKLLRSICLVLAVTIIGMQTVAFGVQLVPKYLKNNSPVEENLTGLTVKNIWEVSKNKNIIVFVIDRFDAAYYEELKAKEPDFFNKLDGFTYYNDYISLYSRTYPAIASMVTGIDNDFQTTAEEYFNFAYNNSEFIKDLKANDYIVNVYSSPYYSHRDGTKLVGVIDNAEVATEYNVKSKTTVAARMIAISAYRYLPIPLKRTIGVASSSFVNLILLRKIKYTHK